MAQAIASRRDEVGRRSGGAASRRWLPARARRNASPTAYDQARVDELVTAAGWAIVQPERNRAARGARRARYGPRQRRRQDREEPAQDASACCAICTARRSVGVIAELPALGIIEIARPVGVVGAITPSTNPGATPANNIINALKGGNAIILAPSPKGHSTVRDAARIHPRRTRTHRRAARSGAAAARRRSRARRPPS